MPLLVLAPSVHIIAEDGGLRADDKFLSGLQRHAEMWDGPMRILLRVDSAPLPFSRLVTEADFPGELRLLRADEPIRAGHLAGADVLLASGDSHDQMDLAPLCAATGTRLVYAVEYTLPTRLRTALMDPQRGPLRRLRSAAWVLGQERRRRRALGAAAGLQFNGYPAHGAYRALDPGGCLYFDGRMSRAMMATEDEMMDRAARLRAGGPIRLIASGRLEPMKGAQDLVPAARAMRKAGVDFTLDIFGAGTLAPAIAAAIAGGDVGDRVRLHPPVDFQTGLVPRMRRDADIFLSCHRQGDPSCSYLEAMGCGLAVIGTANEMWRPMAADTQAGWVLPMGRPGAVADCMAQLAARRDRIAAAGRHALDFARAHDFEQEFARRMEHLAAIARRPAFSGRGAASRHPAGAPEGSSRP
ncbi:glycosyltransferase [Paracoccus sp. YIM 132242]|uniref:Glycosyltransferase n=1 Tax=Paracoccus lichenicola TaxID=2665644 RepID=A0A6L6HSZ2_9RHOB|nr:glycosyltransferase [Paracoccus lichenicola]MTE01509.1 glycosyltransferase [Paracoccus lichenicola]